MNSLPAVSTMVLKKRKHSAPRLDDVALADYGADETISDNIKIQWVNQPWVRKSITNQYNLENLKKGRV